MKKVYCILLALALAALTVFLVLQIVEIRRVETDDAEISRQMESLKTYVTADTSAVGTQAVPETTEATTPVPETTEATTPVPETTEATATAPETTEATATAHEMTEATATAPETTEATATAHEMTEATATAHETTEATATAPETTEAATTAPETTEATTTAPETTEAATAPPETEKPAENPALLDFNAMREVNPDIHAWLEIDGTNVDYPVLQSPTDDERYLNHAVDGSVHVCGSLFTQATYNSTDFNDPVTVIYGHTMMSGMFFGQLQDVYSDAQSFREHSEIKLYLPGETRTYTVFAAVPYDTTHILHTYDFSKKYWYNRFFDSISEIRDLTAQFDAENAPSPGDRVIILSMCYKQSVTRRYLVMAVLSEDADPTAIQ